MDSPMFRQELLYLLATVDGAPVPEQKEWSAQVLEQFFNKRSYIQAREIPAAKSRVERQASVFGRHSKGTDGRNSILFVEVIENRGFAPRCPGAGHIWNQQEPRFIQENQMGPKSLRFFLYAASGTVSSVQSLFRYVAGHDAQASDNSTPSPPTTSTHGWDDRWRQTVSGSLRQSVSTSKGQYGTLRLMALPAAPVPAMSFARKRAWEDAPECALNAGPWTLTRDMLVAIGRQNSWTLPLDAPHPTSWHFPVSITQWRVAVSSLIGFGFHGVSCSPL